MRSQFKNIESKEDQIISPEEQYELLKEYRDTKDLKIKDKFLKCYYLYIVKHIYQKYRVVKYDIKLEMMQECMIRISDSIEKYNYEYENPRPYFIKTIHGACKVSYFDYHRKLSNITIPTDIYIAARRNFNDESYDVTPKTKKGKDRYIEKVIETSNFKFLSLDYKNDDGEDVGKNLIFEETEYGKDVDLNDFLKVESLLEREKLFLIKRYRYGQTLDEIGKVHKISGEMVRQIVNNGIKKIKNQIFSGPNEQIYKKDLDK